MTPVVRDVARAAMRQVARFNSARFNSAEYWEARYRHGRNSGAGSYNRLAEFKADVVNRFVAQKAVQSVIEFGCGDGSQLKLANYPSYIGVDVSRTILATVEEMFRHDASKTFVHAHDVLPQHRAELSLSLDVIYHLVEESVYEQYMVGLFDAATRYVGIYSSNRNSLSDSVHVRHRKFTDWARRNRPQFREICFIKNPYPEDIRDRDTSFADFYFFERADDANQA